MAKNKGLNSEILKQVLALLPMRQSAALLKLLAQKNVSAEQAEARVREALESIDFDDKRDQIGELVARIMPLETLVPDRYHEWRPIVRDAVAYVGAHLSTRRLIPKLVEQITLPLDLPLEQRLIILIAQVPSLQKIGQIVARDPNLDPDFRAQLTRLENAIEDITPAEVRTEVERQLADPLEIYQVELNDVILAEASVSAVLRFTWLNPATGRRERGVFKVLKPYVMEFFPEELDLLQGLAGFFEVNRHKYHLSEVNLSGIFTDVRRLIEREVDFPNEQAHLIAAQRRYAPVDGVRVPRLIRELSTATITATTEEIGVKVTDAFPRSPLKRMEAAARLIEALIAIPLFAAEKEAFYHADPHAGNLFVDEATRELIIFDWALTERLSRQQRRQLLILVLSVILRDEVYIFKAVAALCQDNLAQDRAKARIARRCITRFFDRLPPTAIPGIAEAISLLDEIVLAGISFPASLLMFRKALFTLAGVLHQVDDRVQLDPVLVWYVFKQGLISGPWRALFHLARPNFRFPLSSIDRLTLPWRTLFFGPRWWRQTSRQLRSKGARDLRRLLAQLSPELPE